MHSMNRFSKYQSRLFLLFCLGTLLLLAGSLSAAEQAYSTLDVFNFAQGGRPNGGLTAGDGTLFGTTSAGGANLGGEIFTVNQDGSGFTVLKSLSVATGTQPFGSLLL